VQLYQQDVAASPDYHAYSDLAAIQFDNQQCQAALANSLKSVALFPDGLEYDLLGQEYAALGQYQTANDAYAAGIKLVPSFDTYENWAKLTTVYGDVANNRQVLKAAQAAYPKDSVVWYYSAYFYYLHNDIPGAKSAIAKAYNLAPDDAATGTGFQALSVPGQTWSPNITFGNCKPGQ
jgi:tetratricopeptide (TPR) repeat protein